MKKIALFLFTLFLPILASAQIEIILRKTFVDSLKDHVCINTEFKVVKAHKKINPPSADGDMHVAGLTSNIGLAVVAEIMNAKTQSVTVKAIRENEGQDKYVSMTGAWRIWCEHPGASDKQEQGKRIPKIISTNPDHVFEIHPVTEYAGKDLLKSLKTIEGYEYKSAEKAFTKYADVTCTIKDKGDKVSIKTNGIGYNYVDFWIEILEGDQVEVEDGRFVFCSVLTKKNGEVLINKMRMAFPKGSPAEKKVKSLQEGDQMHVTGVPRVSLKLIDYRLQNSSENPEMLEWNLPVEMIVVGSY